MEALLETGYAELIRTGVDFDDDCTQAQEENESPFPKGKVVFDKDDESCEGDGANESPCSNEDELEDGYEVICIREINQIPEFTPQSLPPKTVLG